MEGSARTEFASSRATSLSRSKSDSYLVTMSGSNVAHPRPCAPRRYLTRYYHLLDALALSDRDVTNLLLAPETVRHCIAELPAKSLIDFVHKSAKSRLPVSPDAEDRARKYCRLLKKAERDLETAKQRLANRSPNPVQGLDRLESREEVERLRAAVSQKNEEISELARDFEDHSKQGEAQVDDLQERLEQATAELELVRTGATRSNKTTENGDKAGALRSSRSPSFALTPLSSLPHLFQLPLRRGRRHPRPRWYAIASPGADYRRA